MSLFLLTFSRRDGSQPAIERFEDPEEAMERFAERERELRGSEDKGVVLLVADDEDTLRRTHSHYFSNVDEILAQVG